MNWRIDMNNAPRMIVAMLAVVAVLLVVSIVQGPRAAEAQVVAGDGEPYVVKWLTYGSLNYIRVWSDGQVDQFGLIRSDIPCEWVFAGVLVKPVDHPFPLVDCDVDESRGNLILTFEDGRGDFVDRHLDDRCTLNGKGSPVFCLGDVDRNGETNFDDLLFVLSDWGECE